MAYDKLKIYEQAKSVIEEHNLFFIEDIVSFLPCTKPTFYDFFPTDSNELNELKDLLEANRVNLKVTLRKKWQDNPAPALQMALMKLIASPEELKKLSMNHTEHSGEITTNVISLGSGIKPDETTS